MASRQQPHTVLPLRNSPHSAAANNAAMSAAITGRLHRGVTLLDGHGAWSGKAERVIMCAVKPGQLGPLRRMVREIDPKSFLIVGDARTIYGHGFESIEED